MVSAGCFNTNEDVIKTGDIVTRRQRRACTEVGGSSRRQPSEAIAGLHYDHPASISDESRGNCQREAASAQCTTPDVRTPTCSSQYSYNNHHRIILLHCILPIIVALITRTDTVTGQRSNRTSTKTLFTWNSTHGNWPLLSNIFLHMRFGLNPFSH